MQNSNAVCRMSFTSPFIIHVSQNESATISFKAKKKKKNYIPFSPVSSWLLPISFLPIIFICTSPSPSLVIHIGRSFSSKRPLWIMTPTPFFAETYWLFWWSRATLQKYSPLFIQMRAPMERASVRINAQISTISSQLHVCQTLCRGEITLR